MLVLQLACVLHMKQDWKSHTKIRIFVIIESELKCPSIFYSEQNICVVCHTLTSFISLADDMGIEREILEELLKETRISATVHVG